MKKTKVRYETGSGTVLVKNVPGYECEVCGEINYVLQILVALDDILSMNLNKRLTSMICSNCAETKGGRSWGIES